VRGSSVSVCVSKSYVDVLCSGVRHNGRDIVWCVLFLVVHFVIQYKSVYASSCSQCVPAQF